MIDSLPSWKDAKRIAVDIETFDPHLKDTGPSVRTGGYIAGVAFAIEDGPSHYLPVRHLGGGNLDQDKVFAYLRDNAKAFNGIITGANLQYDLDFLMEEDVNFFHCDWRDVQVAEPLIDELQMSYSLDNIAKRYGFPGKDESELEAAAARFGLKKVKAEMWKLPAKYVAKYAKRDATLPLELLRIQEKAIDQQDLHQIFELERKTQKVLLKMRRRGVLIDFDRLAQIEGWCEKEERKALNEVKRQTNVDVGFDNVWKADAIAPALQEIGIKVPLTPKTRKPSIDKDFLGSIDHPVVELLGWARRVNKVRTTFAASMYRYAVKGRIHTTFNQLKKDRDDGGGLAGAGYGRCSSQDPNLQQQPARDPAIGPMWRQIFLPDEGGRWACLDYSQQEPRWLMHLAETFALHKSCGWSEKVKAQAIAAAEAYRTDDSTDFHQMNADMCGIERKPAKEIGLGLLYGMGGGKLSMKLGLPVVHKVRYNKRWVSLDDEPEQAKKLINEFGLTPRMFAGKEGQALLDRFNEGAPFIRLLTEKCKARAEKFGFIKTAGNRRCRFPRKSNGRFDWCHLALNRWIQGTSGDQTKTAMVAADELNIPIQLQVHDELNYTEFDSRVTTELARCMRESMQCRVPAKVDVELGPNWGQVA